MWELIKCIFDEMGAQIVKWAIGGLIGVVIGWVAIRKCAKSWQTQKGGDSVTQKQTFTVDNGDTPDCKSSQTSSAIVQMQKAGDNSVQIQVGSVKHGRR